MNKTKKYIAFSRIAFCLMSVTLASSLASCCQRADYVAVVEFRHARAANGRVNNNNYAVGTVRVLNRSSGRLGRIKQIPVDKIITRIPKTGKQEKDALDAFSESDFTISLPTGSDISGVGADVIAEFKTVLSDKSEVKIENYFVHRAETQYDLPNSEETLPWRQELAKTQRSNEAINYLDKPQYVFAVVEEAVFADKAYFAKGGVDENGKPKDGFSSSVSLGSHKLVNVSYKGRSVIERKGDLIPAVVSYTLYRLVTNPKSNGAGVRFDKIENLVSDREYKKIVQEFASALRIGDGE